jgi:hypothetical protein
LAAFIVSGQPGANSLISFLNYSYAHKVLFFFPLATTSLLYRLSLFFIPEENKPRVPQVQQFATGLAAPLGIETDALGQVWVTEAGSGMANDGTLSLITPPGEVYTTVEGFPSQLSPEGAVFGLNHLLLKDGILWILHGIEGKLYKLNVSSIKPGDPPLNAKDLPFEDIGTFVKGHDFEDDTDETDIFNLTTGPNGDFYIVDAAANAVIKRKATTGELSIFATIPPVHDLSSHSDIEAVPTGIVFNGQHFLVCTFTGFPFPAGKAAIYQLDLEGKVTLFQDGLSSLTDIELAPDKQPLVLEYGTWTGETFALNSGSLVRSTKAHNKVILPGLNFPNSIERSGLKTYYIAYTIDGKIEKLIY